MHPGLGQAHLLPGCVPYTHHESSSFSATLILTLPAFMGCQQTCGCKAVFEVAKRQEVEGKCVTSCLRVSLGRHCLGLIEQINLWLPPGNKEGL